MQGTLSKEDPFQLASSYKIYGQLTPAARYPLASYDNFILKKKEKSKITSCLGTEE